eukprot:CAMPEP_0115029718 /NCGR_PEP_ID=MMETSP0216-20121206/37209_1 /TAXON_ID=223996 /ORGANISM="Protocruzia adherens, Strain Boccale" /LENGTH=81 /DNA_ID=CAMNT_0002406439 /DNA_START=65 /DNA_END=307 /DNA_ORIENTATION=+
MTTPQGMTVSPSGLSYLTYGGSFFDVSDLVIEIFCPVGGEKIGIFQVICAIFDCSNGGQSLLWDVELLAYRGVFDFGGVLE